MIPGFPLLCNDMECIGSESPFHEFPPAGAPDIPPGAPISHRGPRMSHRGAQFDLPSIPPAARSGPENRPRNRGNGRSTGARRPGAPPSGAGRIRHSVALRRLPRYIRTGSLAGFL